MTMCPCVMVDFMVILGLLVFDNITGQKDLTYTEG